MVNLSAAGWRPEIFVGRRRNQDRSLARSFGATFATDPADLAASHGLIILAVPTGQLVPLIRSLVRLPLEWKRLTILHCAGSLGVQPLRKLADLGAGVVACHPYQTFPRGIGGKNVVELSGSSWGITGNRKGVAAAKQMVRALSGHAISIPEKSRIAYHASAVIACSQIAADVSAAVKVLRSLGLREPEAERAASTIASETVKNIRKLGLKAALTGPAVRGDLTLIRGQTAALYKIDPDISQAYGLVSRWVMKQARKIKNPKTSTKKRQQLRK